MAPNHAPPSRRRESPLSPFQALLSGAADSVSLGKERGINAKTIVHLHVAPLSYPCCLCRLAKESLSRGLHNRLPTADHVLFRSASCNGKYLKAFNKCLNSKPADFSWIRHNCKKNPELKNAFSCTEDNKLTHVWFAYETEELCEEVRTPMKDKMDALVN